MTAWVYRNGNQTGNSGLVFCRAGTTVSGLNFGGTSNVLGYNWNNSAATYNWNSKLTVPNATWTFVALVVNATEAVIYMKPLNGAMSSATNKVANTASPFDGVTDLGQDPSGGRFFNGSLDEVRIYNTALSASSVAALANAAPTVATAAAATPSPAAGTTAALSVLGASNEFPASSLTYTWSATTIPSGALRAGLLGEWHERRPDHHRDLRQGGQLHLPRNDRRSRRRLRDKQRDRDR